MKRKENKKESAPAIPDIQAAIPTVVIIGRPNVGKSTLFNRLCKNRRAITSPIPGTTRDWLEGVSFWGDRSFRMIDTGGYSSEEDSVLASVRQTVEDRARNANAVLWVVDGLEGLVPADEKLGRWLRRLGRKVVVVVNKIDAAQHEARLGEFFRLGFSDLIAVSASHGRNISALLDHLEQTIPAEERGPASSAKSIPIAIVGRPNVGKSSLLNQILGTERSIVSSIPGTTRDVVDMKFQWEGKSLLIIDTAGLRSKKSKAQGLEGLTRVMAEKALDRCDVAVLLIDGAEGILEGDVAVARLIEEKRRACVVGVNKWDLVQDKFRSASWYNSRFPADVPFLATCPIVFVSAKTGHNVRELLATVVRLEERFYRRFAADSLESFLWAAVQERPYSHRGKKLILKGAVQVAAGPPTILVKCNMTSEEVHFSYVRHLENLFCKNYDLTGVPVVFKFRRGG